MKSRVLILATAPVILVAGLGITWGVRRGSGMVHQVEEWAHALEHSSQPVEIQVAGLPIVSNMYLDGRRVGKFESVLVLRDRPGDIDSVRIVANIDARYLGELEECAIELSPDEMEGAFPTEGWKSIMDCVTDTAGLAPFGTVIVEGSARRIPIYLAREYTPCGNWAPPVVMNPQIAPRVQVSVGEASLSEGYNAEVQAAVEEAMADVEEAMADAAEAMADARDAYEEACVEEDRTRRDLHRLRDEIRREVRQNTKGIRVRVP